MKRPPADKFIGPIKPLSWLRSKQAAEKGSYASLRCNRLASTYCRCTPLLVDFRAPRLWDLFEQLAIRVFQQPL